MRIPINNGDMITLSTIGGNEARAYALTNNDRIIYDIAEENIDTTYNPLVLNIEQDGYIYINCLKSALDKFYCNIKKTQDLYLNINPEYIFLNTYNDNESDVDIMSNTQWDI